MKNILVVLCGGTIGCENNKNILSPNSVSCKKIIEIYKKKFKDTNFFEVINPLSVLSENMGKVEWKIIFETVKENILIYDGIIVTHGSDTLSYTANIAGLVFPNAEIPIVFTASNKELTDKTANGLVNFKNAVRFIETSNEKGVFVSYSNNLSDNTVFHANNICEASNFDDSFSAYDREIYGKIINDKFVRLSNKDYSEKTDFDVDLSFKNDVLLIKPYPSMNYDNFNLENVKAVVHYLYHSSTACVNGDGTSILKFIDRCDEKNIKVYLAPFKKESKNIYSSLEQILKKKNVKMLYDCSIEKAYATALLSINRR